MARRIFLHIGPYKTGSTALQNFLHRNSAKLAAHGYLYCVREKRWQADDLTAALLPGAPWLQRWGGDDPPTVLAAYESVIRKHPDTVVISDEHLALAALGGDGLERVHRWFAGFNSDVRVVYYARRQDDLVQSTFSEVTKHGNALDATQWLAQLAKPPLAPLAARLDHFGTLERWADYFGRDAIVARRYDRERFIAGRIETDFLATLGLSPEEDWRFDNDVNPSLSSLALELSLRRNGQVGSISSERIDDHVAASLYFAHALERAGISSASSPRTALTRQARAELLEACRASNEAFARTYVRDDAPPTAFSATVGTDAADHEFCEHSLDEIVNTLLVLLADQARGRAELERRVEELERRVNRFAHFAARLRRAPQVLAKRASSLNPSPTGRVLDRLLHLARIGRSDGPSKG